MTLFILNLAIRSQVLEELAMMTGFKMGNMEYNFLTRSTRHSGVHFQPFEKPLSALAIGAMVSQTEISRRKKLIELGV